MLHVLLIPITNYLQHENKKKRYFLSKGITLNVSTKAEAYDLRTEDRDISEHRNSDLRM